jgi:chemotaxis family two-component system sensor kinase Cph1
MSLTPIALDLTACDREPIHIPGSIQPHGMMLVAERDGLIVRQVAGEVEQRLGIADWKDQELDVLIGEVLSAKVAALVQPGTAAGYVGKLQAASGEFLDVSAHLSDAHVIIELEPASIDDPPAAFVLDRLSAIAAGFERMVSLTTLCDRAAFEFRRVTGFDRVMVYRFLDDGVGEVVAEARREDMHSFLNHRFPASDIPLQARALYLRNLIRVIPDAAYQPALLRPGWTAPAPLDMSDSSLRSVSPVHLQYLSNMNVRASASVSIVKDGMLWGLIACHHESPRSLTYDVRATCRALAGGLARQIKVNEEAEGYRQRIRLRSFEDDMIQLLSREGPLDETLSTHLNELRRMMNGDGVAVLRGTELVSNGVCPSEVDTRDLAAWVVAGAGQPIFSTNHLSEFYPPAAGYQHTGSGVLAAILSAEEPWLLLWFRVEQVETINWAGHPHKSDPTGAEGPLTPRASFEAWQETVRGQAGRWTLPEIDAALRLRAALLDARQNRRVRDLNHQLTKILQDKDVLLQQNAFLIGEVNHRVQNSLHLVAAYLTLQARAADNPELLAALEEARRRISAVAVVHRRLYRGDQVALVDAARYIEELCADTLKYIGQDWAQHLTLDLSPVMVSTNRAVTLGLLVTELMINANKHAYGGVAGPIEIQLIEDRASLRLIVADKGSGKISYSKGFGSRIVEGLAAQLGGKLAYSNNNPGLRTIIAMPIESPSSVDNTVPGA